MSYNFRNLTQAPRAPVQVKPELLTEGYVGFPMGLRTSLPEAMIQPQEMSQCVDFFMNKGGQLQSRPAWARYTTTPVGEIISTGFSYVDGEYVELIQDDLFKLYWIDRSGGTTAVPTLIGTLENRATILSYNDSTLLLDGHYIKEIRSLTEIGILYNTGPDADCF